MRYFGRSPKEQFSEYKDELKAIELKVFTNHYKEMLEMLELAEDAYPDDMGPRSHDNREDSRSIRNVQKKIRTLTKSLDAEVRSEIAKHFIKLREEGAS